VKELQDLEKALQEAQQNKDESTLSQLKEKQSKAQPKPETRNWPPGTQYETD
jgi:hypothetical protein